MKYNIQNLDLLIGLGRIFDVRSEVDDRNPPADSSGVSGRSHWLGRVRVPNSNSSSSEAHSECENEQLLTSEHIEDQTISPVDYQSVANLSVIHASSPFEAAHAHQSLSNQSIFLVACITETGTALVFLPGCNSTLPSDLRNALFNILDMLESDGVTQVYVAIRKSQPGQRNKSTSMVLKTLMFLGFELSPQSANSCMGELNADYHLLVTSLGE